MKLSILLSIIPLILSNISFNNRDYKFNKYGTKIANIDRKLLTNDEFNKVISYKKYESLVYAESEDYYIKNGDSIEEVYTEKEGYIKFMQPYFI